METELFVDDVKLPNCPCKSLQCAHCSLREAIRRDSVDELTAAQIAAGSDEDSDVLLHALSGAARKLKLPCRRNSRSLSSSLAFPSRDRLISKSWPPLPLKQASSVDSVVYTDVRADLQKSEKKVLDPSMLTIASSSIEVEQEILSTQPLLNLDRQFSPPKKSTRPVSIPQGSANPRRICRYCNREFPSGRALGGHMRVHGGLDADSFPPTNQSMPERQQVDESTHRSSSPLANSKPEDRFAEVNCLVISGSKSVNSSSGGGGVLGRRINSEESMVRGASAHDRKSAIVSRGVINDERIPIWQSAERNLSLQKNQQFAKQMKDQPVIKKALNFPATQKSIAIYADFNDNDDEEEDDVDNDLYSSKLMVLGNANEAPPQGNMESLASECVVDEGNPPHKLRPNPRPSRRRLWPDREGAAADINTKETSGRWSSSPPTLRGPPDHVSPERARPCSECGKVFWSWKALFGHMRCHPEREWRGIQRPDASTSELDIRQVSRACKSKLSSLSLVAGNAELEMELESDTENGMEACKLTTQAISSVSASVKEERFNSTHEAVEEIELTKGLDDIKEAEGLQKAEDCIMKGGTKRVLKSRVLEECADDDLAPSAWPTRKRSRRSRANGGGSVAQKGISTTSVEPALTSETATSSELRDTEKVSIKDLQEDLDMANCLVLLSSAGMKAQGSEKHYMPDSAQESALRKHGLVANYGHSRLVRPVGEGSGDGANDGVNDEDDEEEAENFAAMSKRSNAGSTAMKYECSTCKRCFKSHQALGGHRASHRKTKGCFALMNQHADDETMQESKEDNIADVDDFISSELNQRQAMGHMLSVAPPLHHQQADEDKSSFMLSPSTANERVMLPTMPLSNKKKKFKGHACSICHRIFPSGQALGGHKRCHWTGEKIAESGSMASSSNNNNNNNINRAFLQEQAEWGEDGNEGNKVHQAKWLGKEDGIDLNLPAPLDEEDEVGYVDNAGLSSTDAMDPDVQNGVEGAELDGEEDTEGQLVDYIGGKKRSLNGLSGEWIVADGRRQRPDTPW